MDLDDVRQLVRQVAAVPADAPREVLLAALGSLRRVRSWVEAQEVRLVDAVVGVVSFPEKAIAEVGGGSLRDAGAVLGRAATVGLLPGFAALLASGAVTGEHVDVLTRRLARLEPPVRAAVLADGAALVASAVGCTPERYSALLGERVRAAERLLGDDGEARLVRQQRQVSLGWRLAGDGMHEWRLLLDPVSALSFDRQVAAQVEALFHDRVPEGCPTNPLTRQAFLRAHALLSLLAGGGGRMGRPEVIVVVDTREVETAVPVPVAGAGAWADGARAGPRVDWGLPVEVPPRVLVELFGRADVHPLIMRNGVVLHAEGELRLGRATRLANRAQRRALRGLYPTCAIPGCSVRFDHTRAHHVVWWRHGGFTDLENLLPLCWRHHHLVHEGGWQLALAADRTLTVTLPDRTVMTTGPPVRRAA